MHGDEIENRAIELYLDDDLPHDRPWCEVADSTREGYRQRALREQDRNAS